MVIKLKGGMKIIVINYQKENPNHVQEMNEQNTCRKKQCFRSEGGRKSHNKTGEQTEKLKSVT